jgi:hypothetical protein
MAYIIDVCGKADGSEDSFTRQSDFALGKSVSLKNQKRFVQMNGLS